MAGDQNDLNRLGKHVDLSNPESFEIEDLKKLIVQVYLCYMLLNLNIEYLIHNCILHESSDYNWT